MQRLAFKMHIKPGCASIYKERHLAIWPKLKRVLKESGIAEYSIFLDEHTNTLFAYQKTTGPEGSQDLTDNPIVQKWWSFMADIMEVNADHSPRSSTLEEVFYLE